jgi:hypothetical protein
MFKITELMIAEQGLSLPFSFALSLSLSLSLSLAFFSMKTKLYHLMISLYLAV